MFNYDSRSILSSCLKQEAIDMHIPFKNNIKSLGIAFGDIGTSPIYTLSTIFILIPPSVVNILGVLSLIIWTLVLLVTVQYVWLAMSIEGGEGEGGTIVLKETLLPYLTSPAQRGLVAFLTFLGISFFIGDGVITPAISILSAVEGLHLIPTLEGLQHIYIIIVAVLITLCLFAFQRRGTENVSMTFGPLMLVWFLFLGILGLIHVLKYPMILMALNPIHALTLILTHKLLGVIILSKIILCATGAEALYADMGHLGKKHIIRTWWFVFAALSLIYLGQGAFLIAYPQAQNVFYEMVFAQCKPFYIPFLLLSIAATVIASQAMISGIFSIVYQGITTRIMPRLHVEYTSRKRQSQIYIPFVNSLLLFLVLIAIVKFKCSYALANAYGLAASGTMTITAILLVWVFIARQQFFKASVASFILLVNFLFLFSNIFKIPCGGYWSLITACTPLTLIIIYTMGQQKLYKSLKQMPLSLFIEKFSIFSPSSTPIRGTAVFLAKNFTTIPTYMAQTIFTNNIVYEDNVIVTVITLKTSFGVTALFKEDVAPGIRVFEIRAGYLENINLEKIFNAEHIHPKVIFYGVEEIASNNLFWKIFTVIKKLTPSFVQFYKLPVNKLHGVVIRVEM